MVLILLRLTKSLQVFKVLQRLNMEVEAIYLLTLQAGLVVALFYYLFTK